MSTAVTSTEICRFRGDTQPINITVRDKQSVTLDSGTAGTITTVRNVTSDTYALTVDTLEQPADDTTEQFTVAGTIIDGPNGKVQFAITSTEADIAAATYFYSIRQTSGGNVVTIAKGQYTIEENIGD